MLSIDLRVLAFIVEIFANIIPVDIAHGVLSGGNDAAVVTLDKAGRPGCGESAGSMLVNARLLDGGGMSEAEAIPDVARRRL